MDRISGESSVRSKSMSALRKNRFALAAFLIPFAVRCIPEVLSWPYPIGFDTIVYIRYLQQGTLFTLNPVTFLHDTNLFYVVSSLPYALLPDAVLVMKIIEPLLLGALCFMMFLYARKALSWGGWKSLLVAVLVGTYFVSLRISWEMCRQTLGLIFLMGALISLKTFRGPSRYFAASVLGILAVMSHEFAAVIFFFVIGLEALRLCVKRFGKESLMLAVSGIAPLGLFMFQRFSLGKGNFDVPLMPVASEPSVGLALYMIGFMVFCYAIILPLVILGLFRLKDLVLQGWALLAFGIPLLEMVDPNLPFYVWFRWVLVLVYPLMFFAVEGIDYLWRFSKKLAPKVKKSVPKVFVFSYLFLLMTLSGFFMASTPEHAFPYFYQINPYLAELPCVDWINQNTSKNSVVVEFDALYKLTSVYLRDRNVVFVNTDPAVWSNNPNASAANSLVESARNASLSENGEVYTIWWNNGKGWYGLPSLPSDFAEVFRNGNMAVYQYAKTG